MLKSLLATKKRALYDRVQFDQVSMGGAVRTAAHGWSTSRSMLESITAIEGIERLTGKIITAQRGSQEFWRNMFDDDMTILSVDLETIPNDRVCVKQMTENHPAVDALEARNGGPLFDHPFAMLFISASTCIHKRATYYEEHDTCWAEAEHKPTTPWSREIRLMRQVMGDYFGSPLGVKLPVDFAEINPVGIGHTMGKIMQMGIRYSGDFNMEILIDFWPDLRTAVP